MIFPIRSVVMAMMTALATACWVEPDPAPSPRPSYVLPSPSASASAVPVPTSVPITVEVDTGRTLNAAPGEGIGVFVEYAAGGRWHIWWTCDTLQTSASCNFQLAV